ncbi:Kelch repeat-containing protein [Hymenobacter edaphi]|uniref:IPT/TIG domain-containing protein n=1 Tax=Hymenobacter edaphi TaxID=2211146 RepID=A0A328B968_9BACT|nr:hypothetical protein DLM85_20740 [Hymenobacter edaphi]
MSRLPLAVATLPFLASCHPPAPEPAPTEQLAAPGIFHFYPQAAAVDATVMLLGNDFSAMPANNVVKFGSGEAKAYYVRKSSYFDTLKVKVPGNATNGPLTLSIYGKTATAVRPFFLTTGRWTRKADFNLVGRGSVYGTGFYLGGKVYTVVPGNNELWAYDPLQNAWSRKAPHPVGPLTLTTHVGELVSFVLGNAAYVGVSVSSPPSDQFRFYRYDPATDQWSTPSSAPYVRSRSSAVFGFGTKGYLIDTGPMDGQKVMEYDPQLGFWRRIGTFPGPARTLSTFFVLNGKAYVGGGSTGTSSDLLLDFWEFSPLTNSWARKADLPLSTERANGFSAGGRGYLMTESRQCFVYNPQADTWARESDFIGSFIPSPSNISSPDKGYLVWGWDAINSNYPNFWEFSPR